MDPKVAKETQDTLGKIIKKPPLTDKLLGKPPFRFLHDIMTSVIKTTGFMQGLFSDTEMNSENVKDKEAKIAFLQKAIDMVCAVTGKDVGAKPMKIVAGHEPERTNEFLQALAVAINKKVDNEEYVKRVLKGGKGGGLSKEERKDKERGKSEERRRGQESEDRTGNEKDEKKSKDSRDHGDEEGERKRDRDKERHRDKKHDKDREKDRHGEKKQEKDGDKDRERHKDKESRTTEKSREGREERHRDKDRERTKKPSEVSPPLKKESHKLRRLSDSRSARSHDPNQGAEVSETEARNSNRKFTNGGSSDAGKSENVDVSDSLKRNVSVVKSCDGASAPEADSQTSSAMLSKDSINPGSKRESIKHSRSSNLMPAGKVQGKQFIQRGENLATGDHWDVTSREQSRDKENESPDRERINRTAEEKHEPPTRLQRPASAKGSRRKREGRDNTDDLDGMNEDDDEPPRSREPMLGEGDLPPQVIAARQLARPSSARPAPPRPKQDTVESEPAMRLGSGHPTNVIADNDDDDNDDDNFLVQETAPPPPDLDLTSMKPADELDTKHGALVQKMLESKKEVEKGPGKKTEIERPLISDAQRRKQRELVQKEVDKLRMSIQSLTRSANPLGKVMDYVQEDLDSMQQELDKWRAENSQHALDLKREMNVTNRAIDPLRQQLAEHDRAISDQLDRIAAVKSNIIKNDQKIQKMLRGMSAS